MAFSKRISRDLIVVIAVIVTVVVLVGYVIAALAAVVTSSTSLLAVIGIATLLIFAAVVGLALFVSFFY